MSVWAADGRRGSRTTSPHRCAPLRSRASPLTISRYQIRLERIHHASPARWTAVTVGSILLALITCGIVLLISGENPLTVYRAMFDGALGDKYAFSETLVKMTPLLLTGLAVAIAFRMQLWNIGAEGQLYLGAVAAPGVALFVLPDARSWVLIPAMLIAGAIGGALWGAIPGVLRAKFGANETITTLMLNYVAILFTQYLVHGPWRTPGLWLPRHRSFSGRRRAAPLTRPTASTSASSLAWSRRSCSGRPPPHPLGLRDRRHRRECARRPLRRHGPRA